MTAANFFKVLGGRCFFAEVSVTLAPSERHGVVCANGVFHWLKEVYGPEAWEWRDCDSFREAAVRGAEYALLHLPSGEGDSDRTVVIEEIRASPVDTTPAAVAYAACRATWDACGMKAKMEPVIESGQLTFPGVLG